MKKSLVLIVALALLTTGCYTLDYTSSASSRPVSFTGEVKGQRTHFADERVIWYAAWGLVPISDTDVEKTLIEPQTAAGAVQNLSIKSEMRPLDILINFFTSIVSIVRTTVSVDGDVVR
jgi:hypothetical protein